MSHRGGGLLVEERAPRKEEDRRRDCRRSRGGSGAFPLSTASRSSSASDRPRPPLPPDPPGNFGYDSTLPGPAVGVKREEELPPSSQQRPVVVKCRAKTECSSPSVVRFPPPSVLGSVCVVATRQFPRVPASVRECVSPLHSTRSPYRHRRSNCIDAGRIYLSY